MLIQVGFIWNRLIDALQALITYIDETFRLRRYARDIKGGGGEGGVFSKVYKRKKTEDQGYSFSGFTWRFCVTRE